MGLHRILSRLRSSPRMLWPVQGQQQEQQEEAMVVEEERMVVEASLAPTGPLQLIRELPR